MTYHFPNRSLDDYLRLVRSPGDTMVLAEGEYTSRGSGAFGDGVGLAPGVTLDVSAARIKLVDPAPTNRPWVDFPWRGAGSRVIGGDWDLGNQGGIAQSGFRAVGTAHQEGGIIRGLFGRRVASGGHPVKEVFAWHQEEGTGGTTINRLVASPLNTEPDNYSAGIYTNDRDSVVTRCAMPLGPHGQFAFSCTHPTQFVDCAGEAMRIFYTDTAGALARLLRMTGTASWAGIGFSGPAPSPRVVHAEDCQIDAPQARLVEFDDTLGPQDCTVILRGGVWKGQFRLASNSPTSRLILVGVTVEHVLDHLANGAQPPIQL